MLAWLTMVADAGPSGDLIAWAKTVSQIGGATALVIACVALYRRSVVPFSWVTDLREQMATMKADYETRLTAYREMLDRKDQQIEAATKTIVQETVPAVVRSQLTLERVEAELRARH